jgi:hypothetical protein
VEWVEERRVDEEGVDKDDVAEGEEENDEEDEDEEEEKGSRSVSIVPMVSLRITCLLEMTKSELARLANGGPTAVEVDVVEMPAAAAAAAGAAAMEVIDEVRFLLWVGVSSTDENLRTLFPVSLSILNLFGDNGRIIVPTEQRQEYVST